MSFQIKHGEQMSKRGTFKVFGSKLQLLGKEEKEVGTGRRKANESNRDNMASFWLFEGSAWTASI